MLRPSGKKYATTNLLSYDGIKVPAGYETDGISYKFRLLGIFLNRFDPRYIHAVIFHDYIIDVMGDWELANRVFAELLPDDSDDDDLSRKMIKAVRLYRWFKGY